MQSIRCSLSSDRGFTLVELLVVSLLGLVLTAMTAGFTLTHKRAMGGDTAKTRLTQNLRGAVDIIGADIRVAGENIPSTFPAVLLTDGASDVLQLRRNLVDEILPICAAISAGATQITFGIPGSTPAGCQYSGLATAYNAWRDYRISKGGQVRAYLWNTASRTGEFVTYVGETDTGSSYSITTSAGTSSAYTAGNGSIYILEEWRFQKTGEMLELIKDGDISTPYNVSFGVTNFQVIANLQDGSSTGSMTASSQWSNLRSLEIAVTGEESYGGDLITRTLRGRFFPRNVLSN